MKGISKIRKAVLGWGLVLFLVFTLLGNAAAQQACTLPPQGLVSWWPGNGNANDIADSNNGTPQNGATFATGKVSQAFTFDGQDDFVQVPNSSALEPTHITGITVDAWVKSGPGSPGSFKYILSKGASDCLASSYALYTGSSGGLFFYVFDGTNFPPLSPDAGTGVWDGTWHHVAGTYDGSSVRLYVDGVEIGSGTSTSISIGYGLSPTNDLFLGRFNGTCILSFQGEVDEVEIYSRALDASEIQAIFTAGSAGKCINCVPAPSGLVSWWPGDGNAIDIVDANNGTPQGDATFVAGLVGQAFSFDGNGDFISIPDSASLDITQAITLDAWIKANSFELPPGPDTGDANIYVISKDTDTGRSYGIGVTDVDLSPPSGCGPGGAHAFMIAFTSGGIALACGSTALSTGVFDHLAGTYDSLTGEAKIYVNGVLDGMASVAAGSTINSGPADVQIGARQYPGFRAFFNGIIDEVEIFNRALSAAEIQAIVHADTAGKCREGCSHGFWKNHPDAWGPTGFLTSQTVEDVFNVPDGFGLDSDFLLTALNYPGGKDLVGAARILLRQAVAALLNAAHPDLHYPRTEAQVIAAVNAALTGDRATMLTLASQLDADNNLLCPLD